MEARAAGIAVAQWATEARVGSDNDKFQLTKLNFARTKFCQFAFILILVGAISKDVKPLHSKRCRVVCGNAKNAGNVQYGYAFPTSRNYFPAFC